MILIVDGVVIAGIMMTTEIMEMGMMTMTMKKKMITMKMMMTIMKKKMIITTVTAFNGIITMAAEKLGFILILLIFR